MKKKPILSKSIATFGFGAAVVMSLSLQSAQAVSFFWDADGATTAATGGAGIWDASSLLWRNGTATGALSLWPNTAPNTDFANFAGTAGTVTLNSSSVDLSFNQIVFGVSGYTIAGPSSGTAKLVLSGTTPTIALGAFNATIIAVIGGTGLTKTGAGTLTLGGINTYSGTTSITGILNANNSSAFGTSAVTVVAASGNQLQLGSGVNVSNALTIGGGGATSQGNLYLPTGNATYSGTINVTANAAAGGTFATGGNTSVLTISGNNSITTAAAVPITVRNGVVLYSGSQNYTTGTTLANPGAAIAFGKIVSMPGSGTVSLSTGTSAIVNVGGTGEFTDGTGTNTAGTIGGLLGGIGGQGAPITFASGSSLGIDTTNAVGTVIYGSAFTATNTPGLLKLGTGTLALTNGGTYTGGGIGGFPLIVRQGTLFLNGGSHTVTGEAVVGGTFGTAAGATGLAATLQIDSGTLAISGFLSLGRGNGVGGVSSDLVANNGAIITAGNFSAGFNGGSGSNLPRGTFTLNNTSSFTLGAGGAFNLAESAGSNMTITLNNSATATLNGNATRYIGQFGTGKLTINNSGNFTDASTGILYVGYQTGTGTIELNSGTLSHANGEVRISGTDANVVGTGGSGTINMAGGLATVGSLTVSRGNNNTYVNTGTVNVLGGVFTSTGLVDLGFAGNGNLGRLNVSGTGTFNVGTTTATRLAVGRYDTSRGQLDISGGNLNLNTNSSIRFKATDGNGISTNVVNQTGGNVTFYSDNATTVGGTGMLDLMGSNTTSTNTYNLDGGTLTVPQIIASFATGTRTFNLNGGTLKATGSTTTFFTLGTGNAFANVRNNGAFINSNGFNVTVGQALIHSNVGGDNATDGGLTKSGTGILALSSANTFNGPTAVNGGTLLVNGSLAAASNVSVASVASLGGGVGGTAGTINGAVTSAGTLIPGGLLGVGTLNLAGGLTQNGGAINLDLSGASSTPGGTTNDLINITGNLTATGNVLISPVFTSTPAINTTYQFANYTGTLTGGVSLLAASRAITVSTATPNQLILTYTGASTAALTWASILSGAWDVLTTQNWLNGVSPDYFYQGDTVTFDDAVGVQTAITTNALVTPGSTTVNSNTNNFTFSGANGIGGNGTLVKSGSSALTLSNTNAYSGGTTLNAGTLNLNSAGAIGSGTLTIAGGTIDNTSASAITLSTNNTQAWNGDFTFGGTKALNLGTGAVTLSANRTITANGTTEALTVGGVVSGSGFGLTKSGAGTLTLSGLNTFTGNILISNGILTAGTGISGALAPSIASNLGDIGTGVTRSLTVNNGGTLSLTGGNVLGTGSSTGTLAGVTLVVNQGGVFQSGLNGAGSGWWNKLGAVNLNGGTIHVGSGANTTNFQGLALIGTVTVGGTTPSTIDNFGSSNSASNAIHLGQNTAAGQMITFDVADVTGDSTSDLNVSAKLLNTSANLVASGLIKTGAGTLTLSGASGYTGDTTIDGGTLIANLGNNFLNPTTSALGNTQIARNITVNNNGTLSLEQGDTFGGANSVVVSTLVINAGGLVTNAIGNFTTLGPVALNGGTLTTAGGAVVGYQSYSFSGNVTVGGAVASTLSVTGGGNAFNGFHLGTNTTFTVADVTANAASDLVVSAPLIDRNALLGGAGGLTKTGTGTMSLIAANTFTGATTVGTTAAGNASIISATANGGVLEAGAAGALATTSALAVNNGGTLLLSGAGTLNRVSDTAGINLGTTLGIGVGGTIARAGTASEGSGIFITGGVASGGSNALGFGNLTLSSSSTLDFGTGTAGTLAFTGFTTGGFTLSVIGYVNSTFDGSLNSGTATDDRLIFNISGGLSGAQLSQIDFGSGFTATQINLGSDFYEVGIAPVPEPATIFGALGLLGLVGYRERRRFAGLLAAMGRGQGGALPARK